MINNNNIIIKNITNTDYCSAHETSGVPNNAI